MRKIRNQRIALTTLLALSAGLTTGCVSQSEYDKLWETNRSLTNQNAELREEVDSMRSTNSALQGSAGSADSVISGLRRDNETLREQLGVARQSLSNFEDRMNALSIGPLDPRVDRALRQLASESPDLIVYDSERGMVRLASDLTFGSGSDELQSGARDVLARLASVLSSSGASGYDIQIVGHTDDRKPGSVTAQRHPTNMHLSAHRAIAVRNALGQGGLPWDRMGVAGWGEHRPAVAHNPSAGTEANRRVEIFLTPSNWQGPSGATTADVPTDSGSGAPIIDPMK